MKLKFLFVVMAVLQLSVWGILLGFGIDTHTMVFYVVEGLTLLNVVFLIFFYSRLMRPIDSLANGLDLLKAQDWNTRLRPVGQPDVDRIVDTFNDMLERLKQQRIRYEERTHFIDLLIHAAPIGVVILDYSGHEAVVNPAAQAMVGQSAGLEPFLGGLALGETNDYNTASGDTLRCSCHSFIDRGVEHRFYLMENISNSIAAAERAAYEKVIRIIAHEVNNTVAGLTSAFDTVIPSLSQPEMAEDIRAVLQSCMERSASLGGFISRFADVVKIPQPILSPVQLNGFVERTRPFLQSIGSMKSVPVNFELSAPDVAVMIDEALMEQAVVNIVKNAVESIASHCREGEGEVLVATRCEGRKAILEVRDNGAGISAEKSRKLFTPFYTDKPLGQGIGLLFVRDVLRRHHARFTLATSEADGLTRFTVELSRPS